MCDSLAAVLALHGCNVTRLVQDCLGYYSELRKESLVPFEDHIAFYASCVCSSKLAETAAAGEVHMQAFFKLACITVDPGGSRE